MTGDVCASTKVSPQPRDRLAGNTWDIPWSPKEQGGRGNGGVNREVTSHRELRSQGATPEGGDDFTLKPQERGSHGRGGSLR